MKLSLGLTTLLGLIAVAQADHGCKGNLVWRGQGKTLATTDDIIGMIDKDITGCATQTSTVKFTTHANCQGRGEEHGCDYYVGTYAQTIGDNCVCLTGHRLKGFQKGWLDMWYT